MDRLGDAFQEVFGSPLKVRIITADDNANKDSVINGILSGGSDYEYEKKRS